MADKLIRKQLNKDYYIFDINDHERICVHHIEEIERLSYSGQNKTFIVPEHWEIEAEYIRDGYWHSDGKISIPAGDWVQFLSVIAEGYQFI